MSARTRGKVGYPKPRFMANPGPVPEFTSPFGRPCDTEMDLFFEAEGERGPAKRTRENRAKAICATCPFEVREACLETALKAEGNAKTGRYGVFAGLNGDERAELAKERQGVIV